MDGFDTITMSWNTPMPISMQSVTGPERHMAMLMVPMDPSTFDAETFAG